MKTSATNIPDHTANQKVRFSQCDLWNRQDVFYQTENIGAWQNKVPFYVTSNAYIANSYAQVVMRFMQDLPKVLPGLPSEPLYIVELGAGSGTFGFYFIKRLTELLEALQMQAPFVYVMTDFVQENVEYWQKHPALQSYIQKGTLDFALFNAGKSNQLQLLCSGKRVNREHPLGLPMVVFANYVFDTLPQDIFRVTPEGLQEGLAEATGHFSEDQLQKPDLFFNNIAFPYYTGPHEAHFDEVIRSYQGSKPGNLLFPVNSLRCIQQLLDMAGDRLLLVSSDKGYSQYHDLFRPHEPAITPHEQCFSMMVNFDAIGRYFDCMGGNFMHSKVQQSIVSSVFAAGMDLQAMPETRLAITDWLHNTSPGNMFALYTHLTKGKAPDSLEAVVAALKIFQADPGLWNNYSPVIPGLLAKATQTMVSDLVDSMKDIAANTYAIQGNADVFNNIGLLFQDISDFETALAYYGQSREQFGDKDNTLYNMGICYYALQKKQEALELFNRVVQMNPDDMMARGWASKLLSEMSVAAAAT